MRALPFADSVFDVVTSALVINFVPDQVRALREMRRAAKPHGLVAGYVWDFAAGLSPTWPLRVGLRQIGVDDPPVPGTQHSSLAALFSLFERAGLEEIAVTSIEVTAPFRDFGEFWTAQTASHSPVGKAVAGLTQADRAKLVDAVRARVPACRDGRITY